MTENYIVDIVVNLTSFSLELLLLGVFIYYVIKQKSLDGILLLVSSVLSILIRPIMYFGYNYIPHEVSNLDPMQTFNLFIKIYGLVNTILYTIGIAMLILRNVKGKTVHNTLP